MKCPKCGEFLAKIASDDEPILLSDSVAIFKPPTYRCLKCDKEVK